MADSNNNLKAVLQDTANAIRSKTGSSAPIRPRSFADEIEAIPTGSEYDYTNDFIEGKQIAGLVSASASMIKAYCFSNMLEITEANFPNCKFIDQFAFLSCDNLSSINFPECEIINQHAFSYCSKITNINNLNTVKVIGDGALSIKLSSNIYLPNMFYYGLANVAVRSSYYIDCNNLIGGVGAYAYPNIGGLAFPSCSFPKFVGFMSAYGSMVSLPSFISTMNYGSIFSLSRAIDCTVPQGYFRDPNANVQSTLTQVSLPFVTGILLSAFQYIGHQLKSPYFPNINFIQSNAFGYGTNLEKLSIFNYSCNFDVSVFYPTGTASNRCIIPSIYVPASRVDYYKSSTNWASLSNYIQPLDSSFDSRYIYGHEFQGNSEIIEIPSDRRNVEMVCNYAFSGCSSLSEVSLSNCKGIGPYAFYRCSSLANVDLPQVSVICSNAFAGCTNLSTISIPNCEVIGYNAFVGSALRQDTLKLSKCNYIGASAFYGYSSLSTLILGSQCILADYAFQLCKNLQTIYILDDIYGLTNTFANCTKVSSVYILSKSVQRFAGYGLNMTTSSMRTYVPMSLVDIYRRQIYPAYPSRYSQVIGLTDQEIEDIKNSL